MSTLASMSSEGLEYSFEDLDLERLEVLDIDAALLTELLDDPQATVADEDDKPQGGAMTLESIDTHDDCEDCGLEGILSELEGHHCSTSSYREDDPFDWETEFGLGSPQNDMDGWYMDACMDYSCVGYEEFPMEESCSPLWE